MAKISASGCSSLHIPLIPQTSGQDSRHSRHSPQRRRLNARRLVFMTAVALLSPLLFAQSAPQITGIDPAAGKVNDTVTISGQNLGKDAVSAVYLSDDKDDFRATVVEQGAEKIVVKVPKVKSGNYNVSLQVGDKLFIKPVRFKVEE